MLHALVRTGRAKQSDLDIAIHELEELQKTNSGQKIAEIDSKFPKSAEKITKTPILNTPGLLSQTAGISKEIDVLQRQMADLSNELHNIPETVACPGLTSQIINLKRRIEGLWTQKHLIERNRTAAPVSPAAPTETYESNPDDDKLLLQLTYERQRLADKRSKLRNKLKDPKKSIAKNAEWTTELAKVEYELNAKDVDIQLVRSRL